MKRSLIPSLIFLSLGIKAQTSLLQSGPMPGYAEMKEAVVWLQTTEAASVFALYDDLGTPQTENFSTDTVRTLSREGFTATLFFNKVKAGTEYSYRIFINNSEIDLPYPTHFKTQPNWAYRTDPPSFKMAVGSCNYINEPSADRPGKAYGGGYAIFESIRAQKPDVMLWLGDNTYLRPSDWWSRTGYIHRYSHTRSLPDLQPLLASCNHFAIWDDHDYGPNNSNGSWTHKDVALEVFKLFWPNHSYGYPGLPGIMSAFQYMDIDFILMDNRFNRTENFDSGEKHIFGTEQTEHLINLLKASQAPFKIVASGGQFLNPAAVFENHANYPEERDYILKRINEEKIKGVVFITGDRHASEIMEMELPNGNKIWEFTISPLTSGAVNNRDEANTYRLKGSYISQQNFGILTFSGSLEERVLSITYYNKEGKELNTFKISASDIYKADLQK